MVRGKLKMKLIEEEKPRLITFKKRSQSLTRKLHELNTLCGVGGCMIIHAPPHTSVWPPDNPDEVRRIIDLYKSKSKDIGGVKMNGISDFFDDGQRKAEEELAKLRKMEKYPSWSPEVEKMNLSQLREFGAALVGKAEFVRSRIEFLKMREKQEMERSRAELMEMIRQRMRGQNPCHFINVDKSGVDLPYFLKPNFACFDKPVIGHHCQCCAAAPPFPPALQMPRPNVFWSGSSSPAAPVSYLGGDVAGFP